MSDGINDLIRQAYAEGKDPLLPARRTDELPEYLRDRITGTASAYDPSSIPPSQRPRTSEPNLIQRAADAYMAEDNITEPLAAMAMGYSQPEYAQVMRARQARAAQYPAVTGAEKVAGFIGSAAKDVTDPIGVGMAVLTKNPFQAALAGGTFETTNAVTGDVTMGEDIDYKNAAVQGLAGALGAGVADRLVSGSGSGIVPELLGRVFGVGIFSEGIESQVNAAVQLYEETKMDEFLDYAIDLKSAQSELEQGEE